MKNVAVLVFVCASLLFASIAFAGPGAGSISGVYDTFSATEMDKSLWIDASTISNPEDYVQFANGKMVINATGLSTGSYPQLKSTYLLAGDFELVAKLSNFSATQGGTDDPALRMYVDGDSFTAMIRLRLKDGSNQISCWIEDAAENTLASGAQGIAGNSAYMRIARSSDTITMSFKESESASWTDVISSTNSSYSSGSFNGFRLRGDARTGNTMNVEIEEVDLSASLVPRVDWLSLQRRTYESKAGQNRLSLGFYTTDNVLSSIALTAPSGSTETITSMSTIDEMEAYCEYDAVSGLYNCDDFESLGRNYKYNLTNLEEGTYNATLSFAGSSEVLNISTSFVNRGDLPNVSSDTFYSYFDDASSTLVWTWTPPTPSVLGGAKTSVRASICGVDNSTSTEYCVFAKLPTHVSHLYLNSTLVEKLQQLETPELRVQVRSTDANVRAYSDGIKWDDAGIDLEKGWNLVTMGRRAPTATMEVFDVEGEDEKDIASIWAWQNSTWAVYLPGESDGGAAYASAKSFGYLSTLEPGQGFWVNLTDDSSEISIH